MSPRELRKEGSKDEQVKKQHNPWGFVDLAMGLNYSAGVTADGKLYTWGEGNYHKLGHGDVKPVLRPKLVEALKDIKIVKVACGYVL